MSVFGPSRTLSRSATVDAMSRRGFVFTLVVLELLISVMFYSGTFMRGD